jgi:FG-GAP-like repeat
MSRIQKLFTLTTLVCAALVLNVAALDFVTPRTFSAGGAVQYLATADINGDGKLDVVATGFGQSGPTVGILLGNGDGTFGAPTTYALAQNPAALVVGDFNGDGHPDVVVSGDFGTQVLLNNGAGTFTVLTSFDNSLWVMTAGDFNHDGKLDLAGVDDENSVFVLLGNGDGTFQSAVGYNAGNCAASVAAADFNHDGKIDLVVGNTSCNSQQNVDAINVLLGNGNGTFQAPVSYPAGGLVYAVAVADFNHDGKIDVAALSSQSNVTNSNVVGIFLGNGDGTLQSATDYDVNSNSLLTELTIADFNGDGIPDVATGIGQVIVQLGNGTGGLKTSVAFGGPPGSSYLAAGDLRGTGRADIIASSDTSVGVLLSRPNGMFQAPLFFRTGNAPNKGTIADINGDGIEDLVVTHFGSNGANVTVSFGNGKGGFGSAITTMVPSYISANPVGVTAGDFNHDGKADLAVFSNTAAQTVTMGIYYGNGDGTFNSGPQYTVGNGNYFERQVIAADLNGDGNLDLVATCSTSSIISAVCIQMGNSDGTFQPYVAYALTGTVSGSEESIAVGDFNNDGIPDVVAASAPNIGLGAVGVALGNGDGTLKVATVYSVINDPRQLVIGDLNGDGNLDVAVESYSGNFVGIFLGKGDGTLGHMQQMPGVSGPFSLAIGDFNHDGKLDLAVGDAGDFVMNIMHGRGNGSFHAPVTYGTYSYPQTISVGNFTGHGPDLLVVDAGVEVFLNSQD